MIIAFILISFFAICALFAYHFWKFRKEVIL